MFLALLLGLEDNAFLAYSFLDGIHFLHKLVNPLVLRLLSIRSRKQTGRLFVFISVEQVHFAYVEELKSMHAIVDMSLADYGL